MDKAERPQAFVMTSCQQRFASQAIVAHIARVADRPADQIAILLDAAATIASPNDQERIARALAATLAASPVVDRRTDHV